MAPKKISQRQAMRNRRDLKKLREFVERISGTLVWAEKGIVAVETGNAAVREAQGISWGARTKVVIVARPEGNHFHIGIVRAPEVSSDPR